MARGFLSIATFDISNDYVSMEVDHIASSWAHVYASPDALVFAEPANDWWWFWGNDEYEDATNIHVLTSPNQEPHPMSPPEEYLEPFKTNFQYLSFRGSSESLNHRCVGALVDI